MSGLDSTIARRLRARRIRRLLVALGALVVALVVVALVPQGNARGGYAVPTDPRIGGAVQTVGVVQGRLAAERRGDRVCYSVATPQGPRLLVLPPGWTADARLALRDASGGLRARPGATMAFLGAPAGSGTVPGCAATGVRWDTTDVRLPSVARPTAAP
jgi:hypothetical protein